jgi:hypothetical protein
MGNDIRRSDQSGVCAYDNAGLPASEVQWSCRFGVEEFSSNHPRESTIRCMYQSYRKQACSHQRRLTHKKIYILRVRVSLKFEGQLVQVPNSHLGLVCTCCDCVVAIPGRLHSITCFGKVKVLDEFDRAFYSLAYGTLSFSFGSALTSQPIRQGRRRASCGAVDCVDLDCRRIHSQFSI